MEADADVRDNGHLDDNHQHLDDGVVAEHNVPGTIVLVAAVRANDDVEVLEHAGVVSESLEEKGNPLGSLLGGSVSAEVDAQVRKEGHVDGLDGEAHKGTRAASCASAKGELVLAVEDGERLGIELAARQQNLPWDLGDAVKLLLVELAEGLGATEHLLGPDAEELLEDHEADLRGKQAEKIA